MEPTPSIEPVETQRRYLRVLVGILTAIFLAYGALDAALALLYHDAAIAVCGGIFGLGLGWLGLVWKGLDRRSPAISSLQISGMLLMLALTITVAFPAVSNGTAVVPLAAVAVMLPYESGRRLIVVIVLSAVSALVITVLGEVLPSWTRAPDWLVRFYRINALPVGGTVMLLLLWQFRRRLDAKVARLGEANTELRLEAEAHASEARQRRAAEQEAARQRDLLQTLVANLPVVLYAVDTDGRFLLSEGKGLAALGLRPGEVVGELVADRYRQAPEVVADVQRALAGEAFRTEARLGDAVFAVWYQPVWDAAGKVERAIGVAIDITEQRQNERERERLQAQFLHAQRMESVGRLAGGVAHDFNNFLTIILASCEMAERADGAPSSEAGQFLAEIRRAAERARDVTRDLLAFGRKQMLVMKPINLNQVVLGFLPMIHRAVGHGIAIETHFAAELAWIQADAGQVQQALMNLALNARDAMKDGGRLTLATRNCGRQCCNPVGTLGLPPRPYVCLRLADTGTGIPPEAQAHIFEPFFTTKEVGRGTGLGLASVFGIVEQHGGRIWFESEPGRSTTFTVLFPAVDPPN